MHFISLPGQAVYTSSALSNFPMQINFDAKFELHTSLDTQVTLFSKENFERGGKDGIQATLFSNTVSINII
jgi:hypothetical protein